MSFCDFKGIWWVIDPKSTGKSGGEIQGHRVAIGGTPDQVTILCITDQSEEHAYRDPEYKLRPERIEVYAQGEAVYWITLTKGHPSSISCGSSDASNSGGPGSWTAEDNPGGNYSPNPK